METQVRRQLSLLAKNTHIIDTKLVVPLGNPADVNWDGFAKLDFTDEKHFQQFVATISEPEAAAKIQKDEENFADRSSLRIVVLGQVISTRQD
jgi:hypothetical protein